MNVDGSDGSQGTDGEVGDEPSSDQSTADRVWRVYQAYFNQSFQFWGRYLRFVIHTTGSAPNRAQPPSIRRVGLAIDLLRRRHGSDLVLTHD